MTEHTLVLIAMSTVVIIFILSLLIWSIVDEYLYTKRQQIRHERRKEQDARREYWHNRTTRETNETLGKMAD